jgi:hypothetical protein
LTNINGTSAQKSFSTDDSEQKRFQSRVFNIKISTWEDWLEVQKFKTDVWDKGLDLCHVTLSLIKAYNNGSSQVNSGASVQNIQMNNTFLYAPGKPRREPQAICSDRDSSRTISRMAFDALVMERARGLDRSFSYRDFLYLSHDLFRKSVMRLKNQGKIIPIKPRTNPRFYCLSERIGDYGIVTENNTVKPRFTSPCLESHDGGVVVG